MQNWSVRTHTGELTTWYIRTTSGEKSVDEKIFLGEINGWDEWQ